MTPTLKKRLAALALGVAALSAGVAKLDTRIQEVAKHPAYDEFTDGMGFQRARPRPHSHGSHGGELIDEQTDDPRMGGRTNPFPGAATWQDPFGDYTTRSPNVYRSGASNRARNLPNARSRQSTAGTARTGPAYF